MDPRGESSFVEEHLDELLLSREVRMEPLDREEALKTTDAGEARQVHRRHAARSDLGDQLVAIDALAPSLDVQQLRAHSLRSLAWSRAAGPQKVPVAPMVVVSPTPNHG